MKHHGFLLACACVVRFVQSADPIVTTTSGKIRGFSEPPYLNKIVNIFRGIPFAEPPINDLRFKRPKPVQNWTGILECKKQPNSCPQIQFTTFKGTAGEKGEEIWNHNTNISEDCLYLNIWAPNVTSGAKLTTLVWIFGGGYIYGSSTLDIYNGAYLSAYKNVIVASMNYRVGPFGFLYMDNNEAPGNAGLMDQILALQWIYNNIENFGGSKDSITIFGESAGAASVTYLMASDLSRNYFQKAIIQSASFLAPWAYQSPYIAKRYAKLLAEKVSCGSRNDIDTVRCLRQTSTEDLMYKTWDLNMTHVQWPFVPTLDNYIIHKSPTEIIKTDSFSNTDLMFGFNTDEATFFILYFLKSIINYPVGRNMTRTEFLKEIPFIVSPNGLSYINKDSDRLLIDSMLLYYNAWDPVATKDYYFDILDDIAGDFNFKCPVVELAESLSRFSGRNGTLYGYYFNQMTSARDWPDWVGVLHGDEIEYIFGVPLQSNKYSDEEMRLSDNMMEQWTNFAKTGHPDLQKWKQFAADKPQYGLLQGGDLSMRTIDYTRTCQFWSEYVPMLKNAYSSMNTCVNVGEKKSLTMQTVLLTATLPWLLVWIQ